MNKKRFHRLKERLSRSSRKQVITVFLLTFAVVLVLISQGFVPNQMSLASIIDAPVDCETGHCDTADCLVSVDHDCPLEEGS
ncbi:MAG: hypothetical protein U1C97_00930 [Candidatus Gracilibacteria bacterium]|nr:hypothetical protein [bacterium]MDZ4216865.1 hypothetical protein [Candidatus Gracilibacteria bacterium]